MSVYLHLHHGRNDPKQDMDDWGFNGPTIGPLKWVSTTYAHHVRFEFENPDDAELFGLDPMFPDLDVNDDLLVWDGKYYGDWSVSTERCTGFYQIEVTDGSDGTASGTMNETYHDALKLFDDECARLSQGYTARLLDVGSSEPVLVKEHTA